MIAHRGGFVKPDYVENSIPAIKEAISRGFWMVEVDVRETADGIPIVHHDKTFKKVFGVDKEVKRTSLEEAFKIKHADANVSPLSLEDYLSVTNGKLAILLDVKDTHTERFYDMVYKLFQENDLVDRLYVAWSDEARYYFKNKPSVRIGLNAFEMSLLTAPDKKGRYFLVENGKNLNKEIIKQAADLKLPAMATVNTWHYRGSSNPLNEAEKDINALKALGITWFQIDAEYETYFKR